MVQGLARSTGITATPTVRINGEDYTVTTPEALATKVREIAGR
jgi:protein-disulfide isomerase